MAAMKPATKAVKRRRRKAAKLFRFDRELGSRFVAGADEAGRGSLAGPLVAAAVLIDYERFSMRDRRALGILDDSKQRTAEERLVTALEEADHGALAGRQAKAAGQEVGAEGRGHGQGDDQRGEDGGQVGEAERRQVSASQHRDPGDDRYQQVGDPGRKQRLEGGGGDERRRKPGQP